MALWHREHRDVSCPLLAEDAGQDLVHQCGKGGIPALARPGKRDVDVHGDHPVLNQDYPVGQGDSLFDIMGNQQCCELLLLPNPFNQSLHLNPGERVQCPERFIQQQKTGFTGESPGQGDPLPLSS